MNNQSTFVREGLTAIVVVDKRNNRKTIDVSDGENVVRYKLKLDEEFDINEHFDNFLGRGNYLDYLVLGGQI